MQTRSGGPAAQVSARRLGILDATNAAMSPASGINDTWPMRMKLSGICGTIHLPDLTDEPAARIDELPAIGADGGRKYAPHLAPCKASLFPARPRESADRRGGVRIRNTGFRDRTNRESRATSTMTPNSLP